MTQGKHTPESWLVGKLAGGHQGIVYEEKTGRDIALTYDPIHAPLIAAAPELLAALKNMTIAFGAVHDYGTATGDNPDIQNHALELATAAIAKAEGRATLKPRYVIDGHEFANEESNMAGDGSFPPFGIFDTEAQDYVRPFYPTRQAAELALAAIAEGGESPVKPRGVYGPGDTINPEELDS